MKKKHIAILTAGAIPVLFAVVTLSLFIPVLKYNNTRVHDIASNVYSSSFGDIEYILEEQKKGEGPVVLVSHGITGGVDQGRGLAGTYLGEGYRLLLVSRFGYLKSEMPAGADPAMQADAYNELLDHLHIKDVFIFGNSAGATSAIEFVKRYPGMCRGLILVSPNAPLDDRPGNPPQFIFQSNYAYWLFTSLFAKSMMGLFVPEHILKVLTKDEQKKIRKDLYSSALPISQRTKGILFDQQISNPSIDRATGFEEITIPVLIINAEDDPATRISGARILAREIPECETLFFKTGGHLLLYRERETRNRIREFTGWKKEN